MNSNNSISKAVKILCDGGLVAFPTETVYGLGADAMNSRAAERIFQVKKRPRNHPLIVHVSSIYLVKKIVINWPKQADDFANKFWPGPMTLVFKKNNILPECVTAGYDTVAVRIPSNITAQTLLKEFAHSGSGYVAAPSANIYGSLSNTSYSDVRAAIGKNLTTSDLILEGNGCTYGVESTIIDFSSKRLAILRPGSITRNNIQKSLGLNIQETELNKSTPLVSGSTKRHYCPKTPLYVMVYPELVKRLGELLMKNVSNKKFFYWGFKSFTEISSCLNQEIAPDNAVDYAKQLYLKLNELDRKKYECIFFESPPKNAEWEAINNRLEKASVQL